MTTQPVGFENGTNSITITDKAIIVTDREGWLHSFYFKSPEQAQRTGFACLTLPGEVDMSLMDGSEGAELRDAARDIARYFTYLDSKAYASAEAAELDRRAEVAYWAASNHLTRGTPKAWVDAADKTKALWRDTIRALDADAEAQK